MMKALGKTTWLVPDCFYPEITTDGPYVSHEAICVLNTGDQDAELALTLYFEDEEPDCGFRAVCGARRTNHIRLDQIKDANGAGIRKGKPYALLIESSAPVVCQYSRVDTTQDRLALATTMAISL